jgi:hypothetical protein
MGERIMLGPVRTQAQAHRFAGTMKRPNEECPPWIKALDAVTLCRVVVVGCALVWIPIIGLILA